MQHNYWIEMDIKPIVITLFSQETYINLEYTSLFFLSWDMYYHVRIFAYGEKHSRWKWEALDAVNFWNNLFC